jgi:acyl carrier protein
MKYQLAAEKERIAEQTRRVAEQKAQQAAEEARRAAIQEAHLRAQMVSILSELGGDESKAQVFVKLRKIISDQLGIEENEINLNSHLSNDLGADEDSYELTELVMALEEEFDIEITESETECKLGIYYSSGYSGYSSASGGSFWSMLGSSSAMSSSSYSSSRSAGSNCVVRNFVALVHEKLLR